MCQVNWVLVSGFIAAIGTIANALLLLWMIRVTIRYVRVSEGNLDELRKQHLGLLSREIRPYLTLLERSIRNFEELQQKDLVSIFENRDGTGWLAIDDLLPPDYESLLHQSMTFDAELYESLKRVYADLLSKPRVIVSEMWKVARSERSALFTELSELQANFRSAIQPSSILLKSARDRLHARVAGS